MTGAAASLHIAILTALAGDPALLALLGGPKIFDHAPERVAFPYIAFGRAAATDWSASEAEGCEHALTLHIWARGGSKATAYAIAERVTERLTRGVLALADHRLVNLTVRSVAIERERESATYHGTLQLRAVTEPAD